MSQNKRLLQAVPAGCLGHSSVKLTTTARSRVRACRGPRAAVASKSPAAHRPWCRADATGLWKEGIPWRLALEPGY